MPDEPLLFATIEEVGAGYRSGEVSPVEVARLCLEQINDLDSALNAFLTVTRESALAEAEIAHRELREGQDRGPLHSIPISLKDMIDVAGVPTTCGSRALADNVAATDATVVTRLRDAGAVILGKTHMFEFSLATVHPDLGWTMNPWDLSRIAGGPDGGSAAAVAAGMGYGSIGMDTGGAIRVPAAYCGIVGLKPTYGLVPTEGVFLVSWSVDHVGPMARTCADAARLLEGLTGKSFGAASRDLVGLRLGVLEHPKLSAAVAPDVAAVYGRARAALADAGAVLSEVTVPDLELLPYSHDVIEFAEMAAIHRHLVAERPRGYGPYVRAEVLLGNALPATAYVRAQQFRRRVARDFLGALDGIDAILSPTVPIAAPEALPPSDDGLYWVEAIYAQIHNQTGLPAITVPCGLTADNLPVGMQIATRPHEDASLLQIAAAAEALLPLPKIQIKRH